MQTYSKEDRLIITQLPFSSTLVDFWALVWDYTCTSVVVLNQLQELDKVSCLPFSCQPAFCLCHKTALFTGALLAMGASCKLVGSTLLHYQDNPSLMVLQWWSEPTGTRASLAFCFP